MEFTKTILDALKHWVNGKISNIEKALEGKQPSGDYALKSEIPSLEGIATEEYVDNALAEFVPGEGGASVQSDYEQNDSEAADYIKNRPFYMGDLVETEICDINALLTENDSSWFLMDETKNLWVANAPISVLATEVGKQYVVVINGDKYTSVATLENMDMDAIAFGDWDAYVSMMTGGDPSGFTYVVACVPAQNIASIVYKGAEAPAEFKIYGVDQEIVKIDPKFLPEGGVGYVESTSEINAFDIIQIINDFGAELTLMPESDSPTGKQTYFVEFYSSDLPISFVAGNEYQITADGASYISEAVDVSSLAGFPYVVIGDFECMLSDDFSNFRYMSAIVQPEEGWYHFQLMLDAEAFGLTEAPTELTISGSAVTEVIHKIDSKYLPEHIKSDWNENDPEAEGYIENRPFYEDLVAGDVLFEETLEDFRAGDLSEPVAFIEGETYFVTFNGEEYKCIAWVDEFISNIFGADVIGLGSTASEGIENKGSNNEPFYLLYAGESTTFGTEDYGTHTIKIQSATMAVAKKIDKKFLPDDVGGINIKTAAEGDLIKVKEVDDTGKPTDYEAVSALNTLGFIDPKTGFEYMGYIYDGNWITCRKPDKVEVTTMPDKTKYKFDEQFDPTGMIITATYSDGSTSEITNYTYPEDISETFAIYCIDGAMYTDINLTVYKELSSVEITSMPDKTLYDFGEAFDPTGMIITGICTDGTSVEITDYTYPEEVSEVFEIYCVGYDVTVSINLDIGPEMLRDFRYIVNNDGTYTLTEWKGTLNGETSQTLVIPDSPDIIL